MISVTIVDRKQSTYCTAQLYP